MKKIIEYLDDLKEKLGSDYKAAKAMKVQQSVLINMKKRGQISDETAIKIAEILNIEQSEVLIAAAIARSEGKTKEAWEKISKMAGITASLYLALMGNDALIFAINNIHYAKS